jgi:hypothetical protein
VVYQGLAEERRRVLHRGLAQALEEQGGPRDAEALVRHWGGAGEAQARRRYAVQASEQAAAQLAFLRAARLLRLVLDDPEAATPAPELAARWERAGDLFECCGHHREAAQAYQQALLRHEQAPAAEPGREAALLRLSGLVGVNLLATREIGGGREAMERGLARLGLRPARSLPEQLAVLASLRLKKSVAARLAGPAGAGDPRQAAQLRLLDLALRAYMPLWPLRAAEMALRADLLGLKVVDAAVQQRALAAGVGPQIFLDALSRKQLEQGHLRLDEADALARAHALPLGRELVQINRALLWLGTNRERARQAAEEALEGLARRGLSRSYDGNVARIYALYVRMIAGDEDAGLALIDQELEQAQPNFINLIVCLSERTRILAQRGRLSEAQASRERLQGELQGLPLNRLHLLAERCGLVLEVVQGRFEEVRARREPYQRQARQLGLDRIGLDQARWVEIQLEAGLGLLRQGRLAAPERAGLRRDASWLLERGVLDFPCLGHRALAYREQAEGRPAQSREALRRALSRSSVDTGPRLRWLCLEAARDLGGLTVDHEQEAARLAAQRALVLPAGWR